MGQRLRREAVIRGDESGVSALGASEIETVIDGMAELDSNRQRAGQQGRRRHELVKITGERLHASNRMLDLDLAAPNLLP